MWRARPSWAVGAELSSLCGRGSSLYLTLRSGALVPLPPEEDRESPSRRLKQRVGNTDIRWRRVRRLVVRDGYDSILLAAAESDGVAKREEDREQNDDNEEQAQ